MYLVINTTSNIQRGAEKKTPTHIFACIYQMLRPNVIIFSRCKRQLMASSAIKTISSNIHHEGTHEMNSNMLLQVDWTALMTPKGTVAGRDRP